MRTRLGRMSTVFGFGKIKCSSSALLSEKLRCRPGYGLGKGQVRAGGKDEVQEDAQVQKEE